MEEYEDVESKVLIAYDATNATSTTNKAMDGHEEEVGLSLIIVHQLEQEMGKNQLGNHGVLKATSGNVVKRKTKAETRHGAKERSTSLATLKLIAKQGADEKSQLEEWKNNLLKNLTKEIAQIHKAHNNTMEEQHGEMEK